MTSSPSSPSFADVPDGAASPWVEVGGNQLGDLIEGQRIRWTVAREGTAHHCGGVVFIRDEDGTDHRLYPCDGLVETYSPPLPSEHGSYILAHIADAPSVPRLLFLGLANGQPCWFGDDNELVLSSEILPDWRQVDPKTLLPIGDPS